MPQVNIRIENVVGNKVLATDGTQYTNAHGDTFSVSTYKYYISNISLYTEDSVEYKEPESYYLVDEEKKDSKFFSIKNLPPGKYVRIKFLIGVDSLRNVSGAQKGALDQLNAMFWDWNTGYIMAKLEGKSPQVKIGSFGYHIGGFKGGENVLQWVVLDLPVAADVKAGKKPEIHLESDVQEWFKSPDTVDISKVYSIATAGLKAVGMASNYADMFSVDHVENK